jgi:hypothetical protein
MPNAAARSERKIDRRTFGKNITSSEWLTKHAS